MLYYYVITVLRRCYSSMIHFGRMFWPALIRDGLYADPWLYILHVQHKNLSSDIDRFKAVAHVYSHTVSDRGDRSAITYHEYIVMEKRVEKRHRRQETMLKRLYRLESRIRIREAELRRVRARNEAW